MKNNENTINELEKSGKLSGNKIDKSNNQNVNENNSIFSISYDQDSIMRTPFIIKILPSDLPTKPPNSDISLPKNNPQVNSNSDYHNESSLIHTNQNKNIFENFSSVFSPHLLEDNSHFSNS